MFTTIEPLNLVPCNVTQSECVFSRNFVPRVRSRQGYVQYVMPLSCKMDGNNISVLKQYIKRSIYVIDQVHGQDGWILAKFSFCVFTGRDEVEVHKNAKMSHEMNHRKCSN